MTEDSTELDTWERFMQGPQIPAHVGEELARAIEYQMTSRPTESLPNRASRRAAARRIK